jgi:flagellar secretion chaperone FliS
MYYSPMIKNNNRLSKYVENEILEANPKQLLIKIYDFAILNCQRHDMIKTNNAIQELINSLCFETEETKNISIGLLKLYQFCQDQMRKKNYDVVYKILFELRKTWIEAFQNCN